MNEVEMGAVVVAVTEIVKDFGIPSRFCRLFAVLFGLILAVGNEVHMGNADFLGATLRGLLVGVTATGLYATAKNNLTSSPSYYGHSTEETH